ncbi:UDP-N-acetylmuramate--L-alanine ligase [Candidatus Peregrinibacteria bacterium]|nr:UDP-N-acetylmuramate--L-alanine ligase [Candidatus Peregrinibacteria bacterium]
MLPELEMLDNFRHIHFIGIGGSGISALAYLAMAHGLKVSGSDIAENPTTENLKKEGAIISIGHKKENLSPLAELVIYSEAINKDTNPEYLEAQKKQMPTLSYFKALGQLSEHKKTIVVAGTHGKTTTTAMLGQALISAKEDPTVVVGSRVPAFDNRNIRMGHSQLLVAEGCEYRRSFLNFKPFGVVLLNCELEHIDYYKNEKDYVSAYRELVEKIPKKGFLVFNADDPNCVAVSQSCAGKKMAVSATKSEKLNLKIPGKFNQLNASHALKAAEQVTENMNLARRGIENFTGTARRMEVKGEKDGVLIIDDYGHHPTEIKATLKALKEKYNGRRLICVFQPHQYSRTHELLGHFTQAFTDADLVIIPNIFEARDTDEDKTKISAEKLVESIGKNHPDCRWGKDFGTTGEMLKKEAQSGDLIVTMGAGDVYQIGERFRFS